MSDGVIVLGSVFALALIFSGTAIVVAHFNRRPVASARIADLERDITMLNQQIEELRATAELTGRHLAQLSDAQRFTESLLRGVAGQGFTAAH